MENVSDITFPKSITNPNVNIVDALDSAQPFSFLEFIKIIDDNFSVDNLQTFYTQYLRKWNRVKSVKESEDSSTIIERYRDFVREINLKYSTNEEQKFLSQLDFNDPLDLDLAIPFYTRKLTEIAGYYNKKREESKYQIIKKKLVGTNTLLEQEIKNNIINYLQNVDNGEIYYDIQEIKDNIDINIDELYDSYPLYFNQTPDEKIYDNKDLDYGFDIFLKSNSDIISEVFSNMTASELGIKEINDLLDNKRKLTEKYIGNDVYYLSTGSTVNDFVSGLAVLSDKPSQNFLNVNYPTTASTDKKILITKEDIGYFRPHKTSIINIDGKNTSFSFNIANLQPNTIYYFPDPSVRGDNGDIITFINDNDYVRRNFTSGKSKILPISKRNDSKYYGYISKIDLNSDKYLDKLSNIGYLQDSKQDIYNNLFGLFKDDGSFTRGISSYESPPSVYYQILNGHTFYDYLYNEGFNFNYSTVDLSTYNYTSRSGLSTFTNGFSAISANNSYYQIFGGTFSNDQFYYENEYLPDFQTLEGLYMMDGETFYVDAASSDLSSFELSGNFYYSELIEGGVYSSSPLVRALKDTSFPTITANMIPNIYPDDTNTFMIDGALFGSVYPDFSPTISQIYYDDTVLKSSEYVLSSAPVKNLYERLDLNGKLYVRNSYTMEISPLQSELTYLTNVLALSVYAESLSAVKKFDVVSDILTIETENNLIITKLVFENGEFLTPTKQTYVIEHGGNISNRYSKDGNIYFTLIDNLSSNNVNSLLIKPSIFEFDTVKHTLSEYDNYTISPISVNSPSISTFEAPTLAYNSKNNRFTTSFLIKNASGEFVIAEVDFEMNPFGIINISQYNQK
jgi:hypothetical protein